MMVSLLAIAGAVVAALAIWVTGGDGGRTHATGPTPPADCFVADEPTAGGPAAPTELVAEISTALPSYQIDLTWSDNSDDETCFVLEAKFTGAVSDPFVTHAIVEADVSMHTDGLYEEGDTILYRLYAAHATGRSDYSNIAGIGIPYFDNTITPSPLHTPQPSYLRGDLNCDGSIDPVDSLVVLREDAGLDPNLPTGCPSLNSIVGIPQVAAGGLGLGLLAFGGAFLLARSTGSRRGGSAKGEGQPK